MPNQTRNGKAFEYAILISVENEIRDWINQNSQGDCYIQIVEDSAYFTIRNNFESIDNNLRNRMLLAARAGLQNIIEMEPRLCFSTAQDPLIIQVNSDEQGEQGDVRDIVFIRQIISQMRRSQNVIRGQDQSSWTIGVSAKWNHSALKHPRISDQIDICQSWFSFPSSSQYWDDINPVFNYLHTHRSEPWRELNGKVERVYIPLLNALTDEFNRQAQIHDDLSIKLINYLIGCFDFYKLIANNHRRITAVQAFNLHGSLNQPNETNRPISNISPHTLPSRVVEIRRIPGSNNSMEVILDNGWQFKLRVHNADELIVPSVKLDINFVGSPVPQTISHW